jgi:hypothetical protein
MKQTIKRNKEIKIRLTEEEHKALLERMEGGELATWIRRICLNEKPNKKRNYKIADPVLLTSLARIGGNLNQISKKMNSFYSTTDKMRLFAELATMRAQLQAVLKNYDR